MKTVENTKKLWKESFTLGQFEQKMESYDKNAKIEKSYLSLNTYVQYVEDFKLWQQGILIGVPICLLAASSQRYLFQRKSIHMNLRHWWMLWPIKDVNWLVIVILSRFLKGSSAQNPRKTQKIGLRTLTYPGNKGGCSKAPAGASFGKEANVSFSPNPTRRRQWI